MEDKPMGRLRKATINRAVKALFAARTFDEKSKAYNQMLSVLHDYDMYELDYLRAFPMYR